jgi:hypothetical protein
MINLGNKMAEHGANDVELWLHHFITLFFIIAPLARYHRLQTYKLSTTLKNKLSTYQSTLYIKIPTSYTPKGGIEKIYYRLVIK